ncbi:flavin-containing amine oxidoreductase [Colletotrichum truncatum]|uniref:Flavin-containing amine oxidoreductase n=1 Tax=Colletotrichum truncatum TaxID=5467 RepID=A0ACC3YUS3_COLTU|nr:flavin-containing amine oxidoreductase [Colletotrichum truncatum]KAF6785862.1 flavin-containing amine oxidoreductase [Colletotrichum truncatum]
MKFVTMDNSKQPRRVDLTSKPHIAVVGAGLAGLRCADILIQNGFQVTIIEARNRIGGRLHQEVLPNGHMADVGPNWIHGIDDNPMLDLAKQTNTAVSDCDSVSCIFNESGELLSRKDGENYSEITWEIIEDAFEHSSSCCQDIGSNESLYDFFLQKVEEKIPNTEANHETKRSIVMQLSETWGTYTGGSASGQSLKFFWLEECMDEENLFCAGTYKQILDEVAKPAVEGAEIKFQTKVDKISYPANLEEKVKVQIQRGKTLEFDEVVVTAPLGWLKRNPDAFEPALPARMVKAIDAIGYGCLEKVYINFPKAFWLGGERDDRKAEGFVQWLSPNYVPDLNPKRWNQEVMELASLDPEVSHPTLLFYTCGEQSQYITGELSKISDPQKKDDFLLDFFRPYFSRLPHYSESSPDCKPSGFLATDWLHDEFSGFGSYSNFQVGLEEGDADIQTMREGLPDHKLWLAGEHTAPFEALGTAQGAYLSGESVGKRIAEAYGQAK